MTPSPARRIADLLRVPPEARFVARGLGTWILGPRFGTALHTRGTDTARYCYSVWLRHASRTVAAGLEFPPERIAELGPGDSLGMGLAGLLSGCRQYLALDVVPYAGNDRNLEILDELVDLFRRREPIPGSDEFPAVKPTLADHSFPRHLWAARQLDSALADQRVAAIRKAVARLRTNEASGSVVYLAPWLAAAVTPDGTIDFVFSQAALEHVDPLEETYRAIQGWLRPGGFASHQIDFDCHGLATVWNGHWGYSDLTWRLIRGRRTYLLNRRTASFHRECLRKNGFEILDEEKAERSDGLPRERLALPFRSLPEEDLRTSGLYLVARRPAEYPSAGR